MFRIQKSDVYEFTATPSHHNSTISCEFHNKDFNITQSCPVSVEYAPVLQLGETSSPSVQPTTFFEEFENVTITPKQSKFVNCFASGHPAPKVLWVFKNKTIEGSTTLELAFSHEPGLYTCVAENAGGRVASSFWLNIGSKPIMIAAFDKNKSKKESLLGADVEMLCPFTKQETIAWEHNGQLLDAEKNNILKLQRVNQQMAGKYRCVAKNSVGSKSFTYSLDILEKPTVEVFDETTNRQKYKTSHEESLEFEENGEMELSCKARGTPEPEISWTAPNGEITFDEILYIESVKVQDSGLYVCKAENTQGEAKFEYQITVFKLPSQSPLHPEDGDRVDISKSAGESVTLECKISGNPEPDFKWYHGT